LGHTNRTGLSRRTRKSVPLQTYRVSSQTNGCGNPEDLSLNPLNKEETLLKRIIRPILDNQGTPETTCGSNSIQASGNKLKWQTAVGSQLENVTAEHTHYFRNTTLQAFFRTVGRQHKCMKWTFKFIYLLHRCIRELQKQELTLQNIEFNCAENLWKRYYYYYYNSNLFTCCVICFMVNYRKNTNVY
jgi:hypothetical protein